MFAGLLPALVGHALDAAVFTGVYAALRNALEGRVGKEFRDGVTVVASAGASVVSTVVETPFAVIRERRRLGIGGGLLRGVGVQGLWKGAWASLVRDLPFEVVEFGLYEFLKGKWGKLRGRKLGVGELVMVGILTGATAGAVVAPIDLVATRVLAQPGRYGGVWGGLVSVVREEGGLALFKGIGLKIGKEAASSGLFFAVYDSMRASLGERENDDVDE